MVSERSTKLVRKRGMWRQDDVLPPIAQFLVSVCRHVCGNGRLPARVRTAISTRNKRHFLWLGFGRRKCLRIASAGRDKIIYLFRMWDVQIDNLLSQRWHSHHTLLSAVLRRQAGAMNKAVLLTSERLDAYAEEVSSNFWTTRSWNNFD